MIQYDIMNYRLFLSFIFSSIFQLDIRIKEIMNCFKFQAENQNYLQHNEQQYQKLLELSRKVISVDQYILDFLVSIQQSPLDVFWIGISQKIIDRAQRVENLSRVASAYFRINSKKQQLIDSEFQKFLFQHSKVPVKIKICYQFTVLTKIIEIKKDITYFYNKCLEMKNNLYSMMNIQKQQVFTCRKRGSVQKRKLLTFRKQRVIQYDEDENQEELFLTIAKNKINLCLFLLNEILQKQQLHKKQFLGLLKSCKTLHSQNKIDGELVLEVYHTILKHNKAKTVDNEKSFMKYLSIEYQSLYRKISCKNKAASNKEIKEEMIDTYKRETIKQNGKDQKYYLQSDQRIKTNQLFKKSVQQSHQRANFSKSLTYFMSKMSRNSHQTPEQQTKRKTFRSTHSQQNCNNSKPLHKYSETRNNLQVNHGIRNGIMVKRNSQKRKMFTFLSKTKVLIKQNVEEQSLNFYHNLFSMDKKQKRITIQQIENEIMMIHQTNIEKPTPTFNEILTEQNLINRDNNQNDQNVSFSFQGIKSTENLISNTFKDITIIMSFCSEYIYLGLRILNKNCESEGKYTSYAKNLIQEQLRINNNKKSSFSFAQLQKEVSLTDFYFQLVQQNVQKNIQKADIDLIAEYIQEEKSQKTAFMLVCLSRLCRALSFWYFTKAIKLNGTILVKRKLPHISDPLKFSIALQFLKRYQREICLKKIGSSRNTKAIYECFRYFFYGRKIITKGLLKVSKNSKKCPYNFYSVSLQKMSEQNFIIHPQQSYFRNLIFTLKFYSLDNWTLLQSKSYRLDKFLSRKNITLFMLSSITDNYLATKTIKSIIQDISIKFNLPENCFYDKKLTESSSFFIVDDIDESHIKIKNSQNCSNFNKEEMQIGIDKPCHKYIKNYNSMLHYYSQIYNKGIDITILTTFRFLGKVQNKIEYKWCKLYMLACGIGIGIIDISVYKCQLFLIDISQKFTKNKLQSSTRNKQLYNKIQFTILYSPYYNKYIQKNNIKQQQANICDKNIYQCFHIRRNLIQRKKKNCLRIITKKIVKLQPKNFVYICVSEQIQIEAYRIDIYEPKSCKCFMTYCQKGKKVFNNIKQSLKIDFESSKVYIQGQECNLFETYGILFNYDSDSYIQGSLELVQHRNNKLYGLIVYHKQSKVAQKQIQKLNIYEVDDSPLAYNTNIFADYAKKQQGINIYNDTLLRFYFKFIAWPGLNSQKLDNINQLHKL